MDQRNRPLPKVRPEELPAVLFKLRRGLSFGMGLVALALRLKGTMEQMVRLLFGIIRRQANTAANNLDGYRKASVGGQNTNTGTDQETPLGGTQEGVLYDRVIAGVQQDADLFFDKLVALRKMHGEVAAEAACELVFLGMMAMSGAHELATTANEQGLEREIPIDPKNWGEVLEKQSSAGQPEFERVMRAVATKVPSAVAEAEKDAPREGPDPEVVWQALRRELESVGIDDDVLNRAGLSPEMMVSLIDQIALKNSRKSPSRLH